MIIQIFLSCQKVCFVYYSSKYTCTNHYYFQRNWNFLTLTAKAIQLYVVKCWCQQIGSFFTRNSNVRNHCCVSTFNSCSCQVLRDQIAEYLSNIEVNTIAHVEIILKNVKDQIDNRVLPCIHTLFSNLGMKGFQKVKK